MKKHLINAGILTAVFIAAVILFSYLTNRGNNNMTADLGGATLPSVSFSCEGYEVNYLNGYKKEMDLSTMRDSITPVSGNKLEMHIESYESRIQSANCAVYTLDGKEKLGENTYNDPEKTVTIEFEDGILSEERLMILTLSVDDREIYYYTRVADSADFSMSACLEYVYNYHNNAMGKVENVGVGAALEPSGEAVTSFYHVNINSDYDHVSWGGLEPAVEGTERWKIVEANETYTSVLLEYEVRCKGEENETDLYTVDEFFRVRNVAGTMYLLNYDRTMDQIFNPEQTVLSENGILLGITDPDVQYLVSNDGVRTAFIQANELWYYNQDSDEMSLLFSFMDSESADIRNLTDEHEINLLSMDKSGNVTFAVCGYMNRGSHEGEVGTAVYFYDSEKNSIDEKAFIPSTKSAAVTAQESGNMVYYSVAREMLYVLTGGTLYETDMEKKETATLVENLTDRQYVTSEDGHLLAYQSNGTLEQATEIVVKDLESGKDRTVECQEGECILPLGFVNEDFVCGKARTSDIGQNVSGETMIPMYKVEIRDSDNEVVKTYESDSDFVSGAEISDGMINLERVVKNGNIYTGIASSQITSNEERKESNISLESYVTELKETQMRLTFVDGISDLEPKVLKPKQVLYEQPTEIEFEEKESQEAYYVYGTGCLQGVYGSANDAVLKADEVSGVVISAGQSYVWERGNRSLNYLITGKDDVINTLRELLNGGTGAMDAVRQTIGENVLDLSGCTTEEMLYFVSRGIPVVGMTGEGSSVILIGYDQTYVTYIDTASGSRSAISYEQMDAALAGTGRAFVSCIP